ncbi:glycosyltransferase [Carboxylicivirga sp. RSCT41]|uniref:glycosyltransferase n=1 Tax=Carboxylicivirga agarovorans TaxID=3417570 RepID=UPI003D335C06
MKKRIFISTCYMQIGGVERSLLGLLNSIDYSKYEVDLFIQNHSGEFMDMIPDSVNVLPEIKRYKSLSTPIVGLFKQGSVLIGITRLLARFHTQLFKKLNKLTENYSSTTYVAKYAMPFLPSLFTYGEYDLAISFLIPHNIVLKKVKAKHKIAWIHSDYSFIGLDKKVELPIWQEYDSIASISEEVSRAFLVRFPSLKEKLVLIENILSSSFVRQQAEEFSASSEMPRKNGELILCSVGRFTEQKNFVNAVHICKCLLNKGVDIKWYLVGYGPDEKKIVDEINKLQMNDFFFILGKKVNPYPYIHNCDIYIQPSLYEGKAVTVREAQMLFKPVVITDFPTSKSQLKNGYDGEIVPLDNEGAAKGIYNFLMDKNKQDMIIENLKQNDFGNESEVGKIYDLC